MSASPRRAAGMLAAVIGLMLVAGVAAGAGHAPPAGPPFPPPVNDVVVYDFADLFSPATESLATRRIAAIEGRVGAEIAVYTQFKPGSTEVTTEADARALMDQWGVGRAGFDDGLVILVNMNRTTCQPGVPGNGQVQLFAGPGYSAAYLTDSQRQHIFDNEMLPWLRLCDFDQALLVALERIDESATPEHASTLAAARIIDAALGLVFAPLLFVLLVGIAARSWLLYGKDPVYLDSPSILMPAPPAHLTAAAGAVVWEGRTTRRALTTALLDLASRGELAFRPESRLLRSAQVGIEMLTEPPTDPRTLRNQRRPLSAAEGHALDSLRRLAAKGAIAGFVAGDEMTGFAQYVDEFNKKIERHVSKQGWFREPPAAAAGRWYARGGIALAMGIVIGVIAFSLPSGGLTVVGLALAAAGVALMIIARAMPARTMAGAMIYAMLAAYRRTLQKTMEQARSMEEVVQRAQLDWLETPDQAVVWGVALGLQAEVEEVIERSARDAQAGDLTHGPWLPAWYGSHASSSGGGGWSGVAPGLFSASAIPSFGGMMAALGTVGNAPSSSGSSGGFSGGGSGGGGGGGSGGGF